MRQVSLCYTPDRYLPGFGLKCFGFLGLLLGYNVFVSWVLNRTELYMELEKLSVYETSKQLWDRGFFVSESEDADARMQAYNMYQEEGCFSRDLFGEMGWMAGGWVSGVVVVEHCGMGRLSAGCVGVYIFSLETHSVCMFYGEWNVVPESCNTVPS